ncbi:MAG TPA: DnaB-like helicase C-terminal domain-containing protein [Candidatus Omnitrophota bacterium]|nr:DnaB-like helicase C-terminal domain-containing protein [Candidatus Omnitrophota bacterium]
MRHQIENFILYTAILAPEYTALICDIDNDVFSSPKTRAVHNAIICLYNCGAKVDAKLVRAELARVGRPEKYLDEIQAEMSGESLFTRDINHLVWQLKDMAFRDDIGESVNVASKMLAHNEETKSVVDHLEKTINRYSAPKRCFDIATIDDREEFFGTWGKVKTGFRHIDEKLQGIYDSDLVTLAARPGKGKTTLALNIIEYVIEVEKKPVILFSREMCRRQIMARILAKKTAVDYHAIINSKVPTWGVQLLNKCWDDIKREWAGFFFIDDKTADIREICATARTLATKQKPGLIVVDYIGLCTADGKNANERVSNITGALKRYAQSAEVPVLALSQLSREVEHRGSSEPQLSDLRDSGSIEQDSNSVLFLWEEEMKMYCTIAKNRAGETGRVRLVFDKERYMFSDFKEVYTGAQ